MSGVYAFAIAACLAFTPAELLAQSPKEPLHVGTTEEILVYAISQYEQRSVRSAIANLRNIISPTYLNSVRTEQKVRAYLYLGAAYADLSVTDTAHVFFIAALDFDPSVNLQSNSFRQSAKLAFEAAKARMRKPDLREMPPA